MNGTQYKIHHYTDNFINDNFFSNGRRTKMLQDKMHYYTLKIIADNKEYYFFHTSTFRSLPFLILLLSVNSSICKYGLFAETFLCFKDAILAFPPLSLNARSILIGGIAKYAKRSIQV